MGSYPISYNYNGETILIYPGHLFTKSELISRIKEMISANVDETYKEQDLSNIYYTLKKKKKNIWKNNIKIKARW